jgi:hypothetical protein
MAETRDLPAPKPPWGLVWALAAFLLLNLVTSVLALTSPWWSVIAAVVLIATGTSFSYRRQVWFREYTAAVEREIEAMRAVQAISLGISEQDFLRVMDEHLDLVEGIGDTVEEWARARDISLRGLFISGDTIANAWITKLGLDLPGESLEGFRASYGQAIVVGIEAERDRRDRAELPR